MTSVHCFPPKIEIFKMAVVKRVFGNETAFSDPIAMILMSKPMFLRSRGPIKHISGPIMISFIEIFLTHSLLVFLLELCCRQPDSYTLHGLMSFFLTEFYILTTSITMINCITRTNP